MKNIGAGIAVAGAWYSAAHVQNPNDMHIGILILWGIAILGTLYLLSQRD